MKKLTFLFVAILLLLAMVPAVSANPYPNPILITELTAGGGNPKSAMRVGSVKATIEGDYLKVLYWPYQGVCLTETHLHVFLDGEGFTDVPHRNGNPVPGQFAYSMEHDCAEYAEYPKIAIPEGWDPSKPLYIAAHAVVCMCDCGDKCSDTHECECSDECETAWGGDYSGDRLEFPGKNWAIYFAYTLQ